MMMVEELDGRSWKQTMDEFDGLTVVKFYAPWCRTCRMVGPQYDRVASDHAFAKLSSRVRFFEVNFKKETALCLRERVFALPMVHFYTRDLGRVNAFTLPAKGGKELLRDELDRYVGESDHLGLLQSLHATAINPMVQYVDLVSVIQGLSMSPTYASAAASASDAAKTAVSTPERVRELKDLFALLDVNDDGVLDTDEIGKIAAAVGGLGGGVSQATTLLQRIGSDGGDDTQSLTFPLTRETFIAVMTNKAATEFNQPQEELLPAFQALDIDGDGAITREEMLVAMERLSSQDFAAGADLAEVAMAAFDALDVDKSNSLDYEEFVAMLSGTHSDYLGDLATSERRSA